MEPVIMGDSPFFFWFVMAMTPLWAWTLIEQIWKWFN
jgi:hypothetical protein